ncbi:MAG: diacylglycerol kinase [Parcubacteria group bacterium CG10_big_fil_rev_8_21_14_0_10_36_14]|nr:MAG: diacylglycerol kinase [Parcubacteria group bacterium CG10_big_fil_rev_8_21_14_0_10_36_14]
MKNRMLRSIGSALKGFSIILKEERNFRIQNIVAIIVIVLMNIFPLSIVEKGILLLLIVIILVLEMFNSIMERLLDIFKPRMHAYVKDIKDIAAGTVLISAVGAIIIGVIIFYPHLKFFLTFIKR